MKIEYLNEGAFGSYKNKQTREDKLKNLKKETSRIIINDIVKKLPDALKERIGQKDYLDSLYSKKTVESYNYNFSRMFLRMQDFLGIKVEDNTIYLKFITNFISPSSYTSSGPAGNVVELYNLNHYNIYLMIEALCKDLCEEFGPGINFDFMLIVTEDLKSTSCNTININNRNKINNWSLDNLNGAIKYPEFLLKYKNVYENRSAEEIYLKILQKLYYEDESKFDRIYGKPDIAIENITYSTMFENKAAQAVFNLCQSGIRKIVFHINPVKDLDIVLDCCESLMGQTLKDLLEDIQGIYMTSINYSTLSKNAFLNIVKEISNISNNNFYISRKIGSSYKREVTPCHSIEQAMNILVDETYGEAISLVEIGKFKGVKKSYATYNIDIEDSEFYYLHVAVKE
jgi:hypothetical protein